MKASVVHIVNNLDPINAGIWSAALFGSPYLSQQGVSSFMLVCRRRREADLVPTEAKVFYIEDFEGSKIYTLFESMGLSQSNTVVMTHGAWQQPTKLGFALKRRGFKWVYVPQGMLEPWSMRQKWLKKFLYFTLFEKRWASSASVIRAVSSNEQENLSQRFRCQVIKIENGVKTGPTIINKGNSPVFLFMARLHHKKGVVPLVEAWNNKMRSTNCELIIAGPDEGELEKITPYLTGNITYLGPVYGVKKTEVLAKSHYYVLPSYSEGFPSSVLEAMSYGAIPLISKGCNFQAVFSKNLGFQIEPDRDNIANVLEQLKDIKFDEQRSQANFSYVRRFNSEEFIGESLLEMYKSLLR
jgi:glycosyltransferase involved in cell wall biosynthesis